MRIFSKNFRAVSGHGASGYLMHRIIFFSLVILGLGAPRLSAATAAQPPPASSTPVAQALEAAQQQFKDQNWAQARDSYDHARDLAGDWHSPEARLAVEGAVGCSIKLLKLSAFHLTLAGNCA